MLFLFLQSGAQNHRKQENFFLACRNGLLSVHNQTHTDLTEGHVASYPARAIDIDTTDLTADVTLSQKQSFDARLDPGPRTLTLADSGCCPSKRARRTTRLHRWNNTWTREEVSLLMMGIVKHGRGSWAKIVRDNAHTVLSRRSSIDLKDKWRNLCRNRSDAETEAMLEGAADGDALPSSPGANEANEANESKRRR